MKSSNFKFFIAILMSALMTHIPNLAAAKATSDQMISTQQVVDEMSREQAEAVILAQLDREDIQKELKKYGVNAEQTKSRLASLSNSELNYLASEMNKAQYGGSIGGILVIVVLVLLIIYLAQRI